MRKIFIPFFIIFAFTTFSCTYPLTYKNNKKITIELPQWPDEYPELIFWRISVYTENNVTEFEESLGADSFSISVEKDKLASIMIQPVIDYPDCKDFFCPAGVLYPYDFITEKNFGQGKWENYAICKILSVILQSPPSENKNIALNFFNWKKLQESFFQKDSDAFIKFDSLSKKKCTTSFHTDFDTIVERILNPPSRFTIPYFDTTSIIPSKVKQANLSDTNIILSSYIPLNDFYKEKGYLTAQVKPSDYKTAFLLDGQLVYIKNNTLYPK